MSSFILKIIAIITMFIDHAGWAIYPQYTILRIIGRIAMPIFAYQIALGYKKTSSKAKYFLRMFCCAIISQIPFTLLGKYAQIPNANAPSLAVVLQKISWKDFELNICVTFLLALGILWLLEKAKETKILYICVFYLAFISVIVPMDYGILGIIWVVTFYYFGEKKWLYTLLLCAGSTIYVWINKVPLIQLYMLLALPLLYFYNGKKGKGMKYLFYAFYPIHMILLVLAKIYLFT